MEPAPRPTSSLPRGAKLPETSTPRDVLVLAGQTIVLHEGGKIRLRATCPANARYFTDWQAIIGTASEVDAKVAALGLK